jgi:hypothetical protein
MAEVMAEVKDIEAKDVLPPDVFYVCKATEFGFDMHTKAGKTIEFRGFQHVTSDPEIAQYLKECIERRVGGLLSLKKVTKEELDPAYELRQKIIAEYLNSQEAGMHGAREVAGITKQVGMAVSTEIGVKGSAVEAIAAAKALAAGKVNS